MTRNLLPLLLLALIVALPLALRRPDTLSRWRPGDPVVVVVSPHNEAIRYEFGHGFAEWHEARYGRPAKVDWRAIGGTSEIMRYLESQFTAAFRTWWKGQGGDWPDGGGEMILDRRFKAAAPPEEVRGDPARLARWERQRTLHQAFRATDDPDAFSARIDVLFGGGSYDHNVAAGQGLTVAPWPGGTEPTGVVRTAAGTELFPAELGGETWRTDTFYGAALSSFGICYNLDRLRELNLPPPRLWEDLTHPGYFGQIGVADPTKSGSISKAFEMIVHAQCRQAVIAAGFSPEQVEAFEARFRAERVPDGATPEGVPAAYQEAVEQGWAAGVRLVQRIGANARYFTDAAGKVPLDVAMGNAAAGLVIDFYGRYQAEYSRCADGAERMRYVTPGGGSSVSADPISLLRGAEHRETALRFLEYVLGEAGQKLWNYRPGAPGGPHKFALRRLPVRRDFYPSEAPEFRDAWERHRQYAVDALGDPDVNPYALAERFTYEPRWTARHFSVLRYLVRAMCLDAGEELRAAWAAIARNGGPDANPAAMAALARLPDRPEPLTWASSLTVLKRYGELELMREWTLFFRESYAEAEALACGGARP